MPEDCIVCADPTPIASTGGHEVVSPFLLLPGEIRNLIYYKVLIEPNCRRVQPHRTTPLPLCTRAQPPLTQVNRQLREECLPMYYAKNNFFIFLNPRTASDVTQFFESFSVRPNPVLRESYLRFIQVVQLRWWPIRLVKSSTHSLTDINVSFGFQTGLKGATSLIFGHWNNHTVENAVFNAVQQSLQSSTASRRHGLFINDIELRQLARTIFFCGATCPQAARQVELYTTVERLQFWQGYLSSILGTEI